MSFLFIRTTARRFFSKPAVFFEKSFPQAEKERDLLIDVDGSLIQIYVLPEGEAAFYDDYDLGAVIVESDMDLTATFAKFDI